MSRLLLGCGNRKRKGWVNIDIDQKVNPDLVADAKDLNMFEDGAADEIECRGLFERSARLDQINALKEWYRVFRRGGKLSLELPDSETSWTPETLTNELRKCGFREINEVPVTQKRRPATKYKRDMRLECIK